MKHKILLPFVLAASLAGTAFAMEPTLGAKLGTSIADIESALAADGYEMTRFDKEGARIEVYAVKGDVRHEIYVDANTGEVVKVEQIARRGPSPLPGVSDEAIRSRLSAEGYQVTKYERERGEIEVYANKDGRQWELKIEPGTGKTLKIEAED